MMNSLHSRAKHQRPFPAGHRGAGLVIAGSKTKQRGAMLLEALVAILIFSVGILAVVGMQATAVKAAADAKYRSEASLLANELLGQMWITNRSAAVLKTNFEGSSGSGGTYYVNWYSDVAAAMPGVTTTANAPTVSVDGTTGLVTVVVYWKLPSEAAGASAHNYTVIAQVQ
ncbi:MAG: type IV pilus modification protein PilV [Burkholderiales bacterium]